MSELRDKMAMKIDDLKLREHDLIKSIDEWGQVVDAERLAKTFVKHATLVNILEGHFDRI